MDRAKQASTRLRRFVVAGVAFVAAVGAVAGNFNAILSFGEKVVALVGLDEGRKGEQYQLFLEPGPLDEPNVVASSDYSDPSNFAFRIYPYEGYEYSLKVTVTASFRDPRFNEWPFLRGLDPLEVAPLPEPAEGPPNSITVWYDGPVDGELQRVSSEAPRQVDPEGAAGSRISWIVYMKLGWKPRRSDEIVFRTGPKEWRTAFGELEWSQFSTELDGERKTWWGAHGTLHLEVEDPDWVVLRSARLLSTRPDANDGSRKSLLEVIVENRSSSTVALQQLVIDAQELMSVLCHIGPEYQAPPVLKLTLNWATIIAQQGPKGDDAWTTLAGEEVAVATEFQEASCLNPHWFSASLPVQTDIPPGELRRVTVRVAEFPQQSKSLALGGLFRPLPASLGAWHKVLVSLKPNTHVFPRSAPVER